MVSTGGELNSAEIHITSTDPSITNLTSLLSALTGFSEKTSFTINFRFGKGDNWSISATTCSNGTIYFQDDSSLLVCSISAASLKISKINLGSNEVLLTTPELQQLGLHDPYYAEHPRLNSVDQNSLNKVSNGNYWEVITKYKFYFLNLDTDNDSTWIMPISVNFQGWKEDTDLQLINISFCYYDSLVCLELLKSEGFWEVGNYIEKSIKDITNTYIVPYNPYTRFGVGDTILSDFLNRIKNQNQQYSEDGLIFFCKYYEAGESGFTQVSFPISCYANYSNSIIVISFIHGTSAWVIRADIRGKVTNKFEKSLVS